MKAKLKDILEPHEICLIKEIPHDKEIRSLTVAELRSIWLAMPEVFCDTPYAKGGFAATMAMQELHQRCVKKDIGIY
jgi:hypothetical protein